MKLVIGGAYQGKLAYAKQMYGVEKGWIDGCTCSPGELKTCSGIYGFHEFVRRWVSGEFLPEEGLPDDREHDVLLQLEQYAKEYAQRMVRCNPGIVVVTNELGYGVVPVEKADRFWREAAGRICTALAERADEVVRVACGIGMRIK